MTEKNEHSVTGQPEQDQQDQQPEQVVQPGQDQKNEQPVQPQQDQQPEQVERTGQPGVNGHQELDDAPTQSASPGRTRRRFPVALVATAVSLAVVAGAAAWGWSALQHADRTAPTTVWAEPAEDPEADPEPLKPTGLAAQLLPMPAFWVPGPDIDEHGNDSVISADRAVALLKQGSRGLPSAQRKRHDKAVDKLRIKGLAVRSYRPASSEYVVETRLTQLENTKAVDNMAEFQKELTNALGIFRKGPKIKGHPKAECHLMPKSDGIDLDGMMCTGHVGEVLVSTYAYGTDPMPTKTIADMVREQLDHIASPGESV